MSMIVVDIDLAFDVKNLIRNSDDITFSDNSFRDVINSSDDNALLRVAKSLDSPAKIVGVDVITKDFFIKNLHSDDNDTSEI